jgi:Transposase DDE domain group 1
VADFDGGLVSSDAGALLLGETDKAIGLIDRFTACFGDHRSPLFTVHALKALIGQRVFGLALGYEDLNDHDDLRRDPVLGVLLGKLERDGDEPSPLAGKSTLNRLEHAPGAGKRPRYHKISHDGAAIERPRTPTPIRSPKRPDLFLHHLQRKSPCSQQRSRAP